MARAFKRGSSAKSAKRWSVAIELRSSLLQIGGSSFMTFELLVRSS